MHTPSTPNYLLLAPTARARSVRVPAPGAGLNAG